MIPFHGQLLLLVLQRCLQCQYLLLQSLIFALQSRHFGGRYLIWCQYIARGRIANVASRGRVPECIDAFFDVTFGGTDTRHEYGATVATQGILQETC